MCFPNLGVLGPLPIITRVTGTKLYFIGTVVPCGLWAFVCFSGPIDRYQGLRTLSYIGLQRAGRRTQSHMVFKYFHASQSIPCKLVVSLSTVPAKFNCRTRLSKVDLRWIWEASGLHVFLRDQKQESASFHPGRTRQSETEPRDLAPSNAPFYAVCDDDKFLQV